MSFPPAGCALLAWVGLVPLGLSLGPSRRLVPAGLGAFVGGTLFHLIVLDWVRTAYGSFGFLNSQARWWLVIGILQGLHFTNWWLIARFVLSRVRCPQAVFLPCGWVAFEYSRKHLWAAIDQTGCPWFQLGSTQVGWLPLIQIADLAGVWGITFVIAAANGAIVDLIWQRPVSWGARPEIRWLPAGFAGALLLGTLGYGVLRLTQAQLGRGISVRLMAADALPSRIQGDGRWEPSVEALRENRAEVLLWSETVCELGTLTPISNLERVAQSAGATCVVGCVRAARRGPVRGSYNSVVVVDPVRGVLGYYDKLRLVPFSEFHPWRPSNDQTWPGFLLPGGVPRTFRLSRNSDGSCFSMASTICYDVCFPEVYREFMRTPHRDGPPDFFTVSSRESLDVGWSLQASMLGHAQLRAVECRRPLVRNVEQGYSGLVDSRGRFTPMEARRGDPQTRDVLFVPMDRRQSLYARFGDWLPQGCTALTIVGLLRGFRFVRFNPIRKAARGI